MPPPSSPRDLMRRSADADEPFEDHDGRDGQVVPSTMNRRRPVNSSNSGSPLSARSILQLTYLICVDASVLLMLCCCFLLTRGARRWCFTWPSLSTRASRSSSPVAAKVMQANKEMEEHQEQPGRDMCEPKDEPTKMEKHQEQSSRNMNEAEGKPAEMEVCQE
ncbi:hypothetical protein D1007_25402 [Hordeum vulgare]|nr:hypothetical protein D1007_25402 [Hordeum vulgare]